jgi:hypothetical protein
MQHVWEDINLDLDANFTGAFCEHNRNVQQPLIAPSCRSICERLATSAVIGLA